MVPSLTSGGGFLLRRARLPHPRRKESRHGIPDFWVAILYLNSLLLKINLS
jgi:hypothetical protein